MTLAKMYTPCNQDQKVARIFQMCVNSIEKVYIFNCYNVKYFTYTARKTHASRQSLRRLVAKYFEVNILRTLLLG